MMDLPDAPNPNYIERRATWVLISTASGTFEGRFHHPYGARLSDVIRNALAADHHLLLTDVTIRDNDALSGPVTRAPFICINAAHANVIVPLAEEEAAAAAAAAAAAIDQDGEMPAILRAVA